MPSFCFTSFMVISCCAGAGAEVALEVDLAVESDAAWAANGITVAAHIHTTRAAAERVCMSRSPFDTGSGLGGGSRRRVEQTVRRHAEQDPDEQHQAHPGPVAPVKDAG